MPKVLKSLALFPVKLVGYPLMVPVALVHGILEVSWVVSLNIHKVILMPLVMPTAARIAYDKIDPQRCDRDVPYMLAGAGLASLMLFGALIYAFADDHRISENFATPVLRVVAVLFATNALSLFYEGGRKYCAFLAGSKTSQPEVPEANPPAGGAAPPSDFLSMFNRIADKKQHTKGECGKLLADICGLWGDGKISSKDFRALKKSLLERTPAAGIGD